MKKWLFNPFIYVAGGKSLITGIMAMAATAVVGFYSRTHFDGALDMHIGRVATLPFYFGEQLTDWVSLVIVFFTAGKIFSGSSIRLIDVAGTLAMARWVLIFCTLIGFAIHAPEVMPQNMQDILKLVTPTFILLSMLNLVFIVWMVVLLYHAFSVSCNMKGSRATTVFIVGLIVAEILSKIAIHFLYKHL